MTPYRKRSLLEARCGRWVELMTVPLVTVLELPPFEWDCYFNIV